MGLRADASTMLDRLRYLHLFGALLANIPTVLVHFIPRASSTHLLPFYLFYSHELFSKSSRLPWPNYHILPLITFRAYWPLSQPNEFTNSFLGFPGPFTSSLPLIILVALLGLLYYFLFSLSSYCWASSTIGPFVKSGHQHMSSYIFFINMYNPI